MSSKAMADDPAMFGLYQRWVEHCRKKGVARSELTWDAFIDEYNQLEQLLDENFPDVK